jgi:hypothetical protein
MPQQPLDRSLVDKCGKRRPLRAPPRVQLDHMIVVIDAALKRRRIPHFRTFRKSRVTLWKHNYRVFYLLTCCFCVTYGRQINKLSIPGQNRFAEPNALNMEPKKEYSEHEENGTRVERTTYDDPDTKTHAEEIKNRKDRRRVTSTHSLCLRSANQ